MGDTDDSDLRSSSGLGAPDNPLFTREQRAALVRGTRPMPATITVVTAAVIVWVVLVAMGAPILSAHVTIGAQRSLTHNAAAIAARS